MKARRGDDDGASLDSLLDTMTNVVGILVIVLVVTQLGVGDAVKRIAKVTKIDPEKLKAAEAKLESLKHQRDTLLAAMAEAKPDEVSRDDTLERLEQLRREVAEKEKLLAQLEQARKEREARLARMRAQAAAAKKAKEELEKYKQQHEKLKNELSQALDKLASLEAALDDTPERKAPPPKVVTVPNPRSAPEGAQQLLFVCAHNKVYPLPPPPQMELIRKQCQAKVLQVAQKLRRVFNPVTGEGTDRFLEEFNRRPMRNDYFEIKLVNSGSNPRLVFHPRDNAGETEKIVTAPRSRFRRALATIDRSRYYIRFYVRTDSFDIYVTTRRIVTDMGLMAGWEPVSSGWNYTTHLGGKFRFGPPPKPAAKPKTPPKPRPKRLPNEID